MTMAMAMTMQYGDGDDNAVHGDGDDNGDVAG